MDLLLTGRPRAGRARLLLALACACAALSAAAATNAPALRTWTDRQGGSVRAEFLELQQEDALFRREDGAKLRLRLGALSPADQAAVRELDASQKRGPAAQERGAKPELLPLFLEGPGAKSHALYRHAHFTARVLPRGDVTLPCLDGTNEVGRPITLGPGYGYTDTSRNRWVGRRVTAFDSYPPPTLQPGVLTFTGTLEDYVKFTLNYAFKENTVQAWGWVEDPPGIKYPTRYALRFNFTASHTFEPAVPMTERQRVLAPFSVVIDPLEGEVVRHPYWKGIPRMESPARRVDVGGPVYGPRKLSVTPLSLKEGPLAPWIYQAFAPYQGYSVGLQKSDDSLRSDRCRIILTVD